VGTEADAVDDREPIPWRLVLLGGAALCATLLAGFLFFAEVLYVDVDGALALTQIRDAATWADCRAQSQISHLQGMGAQLLPMNPWINPGYAILLRGTTLPWISASYLIFAGCLFGAVFGLGLALRAGPVRSVVAAQLTCLMLFPPLEQSAGLAVQLRLNPGVVFYAAIALVLVGMLVRLGTRATPLNAVLLVAPSLLFVYSILCDPIWTIVPYLSLWLFFLAALVADRTPRTDRWRGGALLFGLVVLGALTVPSYLWVLLNSAARFRFPTEIIGEPQSTFHASLLFQNTRTALLFVVLSAGAALALTGKDRVMRVFAAATLAHLALLTGMSAVMLFTDINWTYPLPEHFQVAALPFYLLVADAGWRRAADLAREPSRRLSGPLARLVGAASRGCSGLVARLPRSPALAVCLVPAVGALLLAARIAGEDRRPGPLDRDYVERVQLALPELEVLQERLVTKPGEPFRGSVATVLPEYGEEIKNGLLSHLWKKGIPTLEEYSQLLTPQMYYLVTRGLGRPEDEPAGRNRVRVTVPRVDLLRALGVRFVWASDAEEVPLRGVPRARPVAVEHTPGFRLYELDDPNRGTFSPTRILTSRSAKGTVDLLLAAGTDLGRDVVLTEAVAGPLVPAREAVMRFGAGGVRVSARSDGRSLLLLPLQFSHALHLRAAVGEGRLLRANLAQTALVFDREIDAAISLDFGFGRTAERARDIADSATLGIGEDGSRRIDRRQWERLHPLQLFRLFGTGGGGGTAR
jgi:hypothetical protein